VPAPVEIRIENLHKAFGHHRVLRGVDMQIRRGELVALVGGSGCGKTVLLHHVIGHHKPDQGRILLADHDQPGSPLVDIALLDDEELDRFRLHSAMVFQRNALFSATVYENIALWLREIRRMDEAVILERAKEALHAVGLGDGPGILDKERSELSGGMAKRVAIARALAMRPSTLFFDEPTTGLDPSSASTIHELILETHRRTGQEGIATTTLIVTHDKDLLRRLDLRVVMLHEGCVLFDGPYQEFSNATSEEIRPYIDVMPTLHADAARADI